MLRSIGRAAFVLTLLAALPARGQTYTIEKLGWVGSPLNYAEGINDSEVAVGGCDPSSTLRDFALTAAVFQNGQTSSAGVLIGFEGTYAYAINENGRSVGWADMLIGIYPGGGELIHAALFAHGTAQDLGALPPGNLNNSTAYAINDNDVAVGYSVTGTGATHAASFAFFQNRTVTDLGVLAGDSSSTAYGINHAGVIVGGSFDSNENEHAVQFAPNGVTFLGTLPGDTISEAHGINNQGQAVGYSTSLHGQSRAVLFAGGQVIDLGIHPGGTHSAAAAINDFGVVIGTGDIGDGGFDRGLVFQNGQITVLPLLPGGSSSSPRGLNDRGDIVGVADDGNGVVWAVKWTLAHQATGSVAGRTP
jgi:probable HAF family extracellular repeat protein